MNKTLATIKAPAQSMLFRRVRINKQVVFATLGNCLECYDVTLYSFFATILAPLFFPSDKPGLSLLASFVAFALGMAMRPLGGILFGHVGDKYGRKYALKTSLFLIVLPTLVISLLPTYQEIGATAPIILVCCLLLQGLCVGGEYSGASVFVVEHTKKNNPSFWGAILISSGFLGSLIGTLMGYLFTKYFDPAWAWRFPFLIGGIVGLVGFHRSYKLQETPDFQKIIDEKLTVTRPLLTVLKKYPLNFLCVICVGGASFIPLYVGTTYLGSILSQDLKLAHSQIMLFYSLAMVIYLIFLPIMGALGDRFGAKRMMITGAVGMIASSYFLFNLLESPTVITAIISQVVWSFLNTAFSGPSLLFKASLFPTTSRHSALGVGYNLGGAIFGGTGPLICAALVEWKNNYSAAGLYVAFGGILGLIGVCLARKVDHSFEKQVENEKIINQMVA